jgi:YVTN family beta-propeller protein
MESAQVTVGKTLLALVIVILAIAGWWAYGRYLSIPTNVAYVTEEDGAISVIDLKSLTVVKRIQPADVNPRGEALTLDGKYLFTANKNTSDATVFDTRGLRLVQRLAVGDNPEFVKLQPGGEWMFTSYEPGSVAGPPQEKAIGDADDDNGPPAQIVSFHVGNWDRGQSFTAGQETEGLEFSADGKTLIVANEAQDTLGVYDVASGREIQSIQLGKIGHRPRGIKRSPQGNGYVVTMEGSGTLVQLGPNFNVVRNVSTAAKPYGVAFDRKGERIFVAAAAAQKFQVYSASSLQLIGEVPVGKRCWHFTFTPDDSDILLACGRSNQVYVIDPNSYKAIKVIGGFHTPWGVITYPHSYGSLDLP